MLTFKEFSVSTRSGDEMKQHQKLIYPTIWNINVAASRWTWVTLDKLLHQLPMLIITHQEDLVDMMEIRIISLNSLQKTFLIKRRIL